MIKLNGYQKIELPDRGVDLYEVNHLKGELVAGHYHDHFQILYALEGEGEINLDGKTYEFSKDCVVVIVPNSVHAIKAQAKLTVLVLAFSVSFLTPYGNDEITTYLQDQSLHFILDSFSVNEIKALFRKLLYEQQNNDQLSKFAIHIYLWETLLLLLRKQTSTKFQDANDVRSSKLQDYIDNHYYENITAESLSSLFDISTRYMNEFYKKKYDETPLQYLQKVRINRAKVLLQETEKDIVSICFEVGYENLSTFYRTFRNLVGVSPNKYRTTHSILIETPAQKAVADLNY